jgi:peptidoglycan/LPS O-acetylase OafA/YrhL
LLLCLALPIAMRTATYLDLHATPDYPEFWRVFRSPFHMTLDGLVVGVLIAIAQHGGVVHASRRVGACMLGLGMLAMFLWLGSDDLMATISLGDASLQPVLIAVLAGVITLGAVQLADTVMPVAAPFRLLSRLSYSLYLVHYPLIPLAVAIGGRGGALPFWLCYLCISLLAAILLHLVVERPFLRFKDRLARRDVRPGPSATMAL